MRRKDAVGTGVLMMMGHSLLGRLIGPGYKHEATCAAEMKAQDLGEPRLSIQPWKVA